MKLSDIDTMHSAKSNYHSLRDQLSGIKKHSPEILRFSGSYEVKHRGVLGQCKLIAVEILTKEFDEAKTKLMLYGVNDFEGYE